MTSTYSSIATNMWPPPSSEMTSRLQRLQELEQMRRQRQAASGTLHSEPTDAGTRLSRRQQISGSIGMHKLTESHEQKRKTILGRRALNEQGSTNSRSMSHENLENTRNYGGARPKNVDSGSFLRKNVLSETQNEYAGRDRSSSLNTEDAGTVPLLRSHSVTGLQSDHTDSYKNIIEGIENLNGLAQTYETVRNTSVSEDEDDIEDFKRSLFGKYNIGEVPQERVQTLQPRFQTLTQTTREIDASKLLIHHTDPSERSSSFKSTSISNQPQRVQNMVNESMKRLDSLFDTPKMPSFKSETLPRSQSRSERHQQHIPSRSERVEQLSRSLSRESDSIPSRLEHLEQSSRTVSRETDSRYLQNRDTKRQTEQLLERNNVLQQSQNDKDLSSKQPSKLIKERDKIFGNPEKTGNNSENQVIHDTVDKSNTTELQTVGNQSYKDEKYSDSTLHKEESEKTNSVILETNDLSESPLPNMHTAGVDQHSDKGLMGAENVAESPLEISSFNETKTKVMDMNSGSEFQENIDENTNEIHSSSSPFIRKEDEDDLVDASNVGLFELDKNSLKQFDQSADFPKFTNNSDFLRYDDNIRNQFESTENSYQSPSADSFSSRSYRSMSVDNGHSHYRTLPYSRQEESGYHSYRENTGTNFRKTSLGVSGISQDTLSRIDNLFGKKQETIRASDFQTSLPRRRLRDSLVGSRSSITRSQSDAGEGKRYESRAALYKRTHSIDHQDENVLEDQRNHFQQYPSSDLEEIQSANKASFFNEFQTKREENANRIERIRKRIYSSGESHSSIGTSREITPSTYSGSRSIDDTTNKNDHSNKSSSDVSENVPDLISEINKLSTEISSEYFDNDVSDMQDSSKTITPDTETWMEILNDQGDNSEVETVVEEDLNFKSTHALEVGQVLVCMDKNKDSLETNVNNITSVQNIHNNNEMITREHNKTIDVDFKGDKQNNNVEEWSNQNINEENVKSSTDNSDETDNKSIHSNTSSNSSSKKKKSKKKSKKGSNPDLSKIFSHPSELLKKGNKNQNKTSEDTTIETERYKDKNTKREKQSPKTTKIIKADNGSTRSKNEKVNGKSVGKDDKIKDQKGKKGHEVIEKNVEKDIKNKDKKDEKEGKTKKGGKDGSGKEKTEEQISPKKDKKDVQNKSTDSPKSQSKLKNMFDTIIHALDRRSDTSSVTSSSVEDNGSGEKTPVADDWEVIPDPSTSDLDVINEDNYAVFEDEDIEPVEIKRKLSDENSCISTDYYETASDHTISGTSEYEEFYEAYPTELLGGILKENPFLNETERREQFVYVCATSKVRVKRRKIKEISGRNLENINQWISDNLYPGEKYPQKEEKVSNTKFAEKKQLNQSEDVITNSFDNETDFNVKSRNSEHLVQGKQEDNLISEMHLKSAVVIQNSECSEKNITDTVIPDKNDCNINDEIVKMNDTSFLNLLESKTSKTVQSDHEQVVGSCDEVVPTSENIADIESVKIEDIPLTMAHHHSESKSLEDIDLDLKASDSAFTDVLVKALREKLCVCCQGVLVDVLKQSYFTRYQEISKISLTGNENKLSDLATKEKVPSSSQDKFQLPLNEQSKTDGKKILKTRKLEVEDLLYDKSSKSEHDTAQRKTGCQSGDKNDPQLELRRTTSPQNSKRKEKQIILAKNDNFVGSNGKTSPQKQSLEVKVKGRIVTLDRNKKEGKVSPKSEQKISPKQNVSTKSEQSRGSKPEVKPLFQSTKSDKNNGSFESEKKGKQNGSSKTENEKEDSDKYKLPTLKDNPFIKSDKLKTNNKSEIVTKSSMIKRSTSLNINSSKPILTKPKSVKGNEEDLVSPTFSSKKEIKLETAVNGHQPNTLVKTESEMNGHKKVTTDCSNVSDTEIVTDKNCKSKTKISQKSGNKPSMFDHLKFAKSVCEVLGPKDLAPEMKTETKSQESLNENSECETVSKKSKTPAKKIKSSPKGDVIDDLSPIEANDLLDGDEEIAPHRINLINWDPTKLLKVMYTVKLNKDTTEDISHQYVNMEGLMEKLPMNKKKATLLKTWKRRFFRAKDGWLHYYETSNREKPSDSVQLMGGKIEDLGSRVLGIDDGRGRFLMVRCPTEKEYGQWKLALESQTVSNVTYVRPALSSPQHPEKKVIIIDIGSGGIRAGVMGAQPCLPQMFFPSVVARNKTTKELVIGTDAYKPEIRKESVLVKLVEPSNKVDKDHARPFAIDMDIMTAVFDYIFKGLNVDPAKYWIMLSTPYKLGDSPMGNLMEILTDKFHTKGVCMVLQSLLALYSYNTTSGIMVDIGERMEILPIFDGVLIEGGVSRQAYGGQKVVDSLKSSLTQLDYNFLTPVDKLLVRYVMEQSCYVCDNYKEEKSKCDRDPESYQTTIYLNNFDLPEDAHLSVTHDLSCFNSTEGFFNADLWGMDYPCVHKLVYNAIQSCPMDNRKHMYRAIYLSGGVTMLPGFAERLEKELKKLAPPTVLIEVHCSPQRYHSAFIGAGTLLSNVQINEQIFISADEWKRDGAKAFRKWKGPS